MSRPKLFYPPNSLFEALRDAAPRTVKACLAEAEKNVAALGPACREAAGERIAILEARIAEIPSGGEETLREIYRLSASVIGLAQAAGLPRLDAASQSLCDVTDALIESRAVDPEPVRVHVQAMRLMLSPEQVGDPALAAVAEGLAKVRARLLSQPPQTQPSARAV